MSKFMGPLISLIVVMSGETALPLEIETKATTCYSGAGRPVCPTIYELRNHPLSDSNYRYRDPFSDPSFPGSDPSKYRKPLQVLDLTRMNLNQKASANFNFSEFLSAEKGPLGILARVLLDRLERMRADFGRSIYITSGYRSPGYNAGIPGSAAWSRHMYGDAVDIVVNGFSVNGMKRVCEGRGGFALTYQDGHVHCDWRTIPQDTDFFGRLSQDAIATNAQVAEALAALVQIEMEQIGSTVHLAATGVSEEEGPLTHEWLIRNLATDAAIESEETVVEVDLEPGVYSVQVTLGQAVVALREVTVSGERQ